jgi:steroid delta-isomerase-like uncharacterized protein
MSPLTEQPGPDQSASAAEAAASEALDRWYSAWNAHDARAILALTTEDIRYEDPMAPEPIMHGREQIEPYLHGGLHAVPDLHIEMLDKWVTPGGQVIASAFQFTATFSAPLNYPGRPSLAPTGRKLQVTGMDRSEIRDSRLARHQIFWDAAELGRQMGLLPPRNSPAERFGLRLQHLAARRMRRQNQT